ncbi:putative capsid protein [Dragonfly larvae associated circular virus-1]|uniref:Putative capsid protein n=1 Tax=Dragonfly larvae associated circular virus-1 TaxID=1454021 RepID=W5U1R6_9VIRU|nr:putative capsid protein [Dragonfly larvae associated circular virus-1]AHH31461.1 putative capsid protein [Dragonfly larvae associated circular virus-1]
MTRTFNYGHPLRVVGTIAANQFYNKYIAPWKDRKHPDWLSYKPIDYSSIYKPDHGSKPLPKKKESTMGAEDIPIGVKKNVVSVHTGLKRLKGMVAGHISYRDSYPALLVCDEGYQNVTAPVYIGTTSQFLTATSNGVASNRDSVSYASWFALNPEQGIAAGSIISANTAPACDKIGLQSSTTYLDFKNDTTNICYYKVHIYMAKTDTNQTVLSEFNNSTGSDNLYNSNFAYGTGVGTVLPATSGNEQTNAYIASSTSQIESCNMLPYTKISSKRLVRSVWKKIKTISHVFSGGDAWKLIVNIKHNQFGLRERLNTLSVVFPKGCVCFLFEMQGGTVYNTANSAFGYSACQMAVNITRKIHLSPMAIPNKRFESRYVGAGREFQGALLGTEKDLYHNTEVGAVPAKIV